MGKTKVFSLLLVDKTTSSRWLARSLTSVYWANHEAYKKLSKKENKHCRQHPYMTSGKGSDADCAQNWRLCNKCFKVISQFDLASCIKRFKGATRRNESAAIIACSIFCWDGLWSTKWLVVVSNKNIQPAGNLMFCKRLLACIRQNFFWENDAKISLSSKRRKRCMEQKDIVYFHGEKK